MKKKDIPQDKTLLGKFTREIYYVKNEKGEYETALSEGWDVKNDALENTWDDVRHRTEDAKKQFLKGEASPILYFMELNVMDIGVLSAYTGIWSFFVKRHLKLKNFKKLSDKTLNKYAEVFDITPNELKHFE